MYSMQYLLTALVVVAIPGTGALYAVSVGVSRGWRAGIAAALGCTLGIVPHLVASALGLSVVMNMGAQIMTPVRLAGAAYLLYLAWQMWRDTGSTGMTDEASTRSTLEVVWRAVVLNLLNPKLTIFFLAFLPHFVSADAGPAWQQLASLSAVFMAMTFAVFAVYAVLAYWVRRLIAGTLSARRWVQRSFAAVFAGLAVELAVTDR